MLVVTPWFPTRTKPSSGIFTVRDVELLQQDHEVTVLHLVNPGDMSSNEVSFQGITLLRQPYSFLNPVSVLRAALTVKQLSKSHDIVHTMAMSSLLPTLLASTKKPWVHTEHFSELVNPTLSRGRKILLAFLKNLYRFPGETVAVGKQLAQTIDQYRSEPTSVIGNYVRFPKPDSHIRKGAKDSVVRVLAVGGLISRKGPTEAVDAVALLRERGVDATLSWAGTGNLESAVRERISSHQLEDYVKILGHVDPDELSSHFTSSDVFVLPTEAETFGVVFAEALASGLPVVTSGVGGHLDFLPPRGSRVVRDRTGVAIADAVQELLADPQRMTRTELVNYASKIFSEETRRLAYKKVYFCAVNRNSRSKT